MFRFGRPLLLALVGAILAGTIGPGPPALAATFSVNSVGDGGDADGADGVCDDGSGACTLRAAIEQANASPGPDVIEFDIAGDGPHTIQPTTELPVVSDTVEIDGYTQPGAVPNTNPVGQGLDSVLQVELDGSLVVEDFPEGLVIAASDCVVRGLVINRFAGLYGVEGASIRIASASGVRIEGNYIGTDVTGTLAPGSGGGIAVGGPDNVVGGTTPDARNLISGNQGDGVTISTLSGNAIQGNLIGTDRSGAFGLGNTDHGVTSRGDQTTIGGDTPGAGNVISGNHRDGIFSIGADALIQGNLIGTNVDGTGAIPNRDNGITCSWGPYRIGGTTPLAGNVVSGNQRKGMVLAGPQGTSNRVEGNFVGTNSEGTAALPNHQVGIELNSVGLTVGGDAEGAGNVISGNGDHGVLIACCWDNVVTGNRIGVGADGSTPIPNTGDGVRVGAGGSTSRHRIGGTGSGEGNLIAHNGGVGVGISSSTTRTPIRANAIHANADLGIDLGGDGVSENDPDDGDSGANNLQNWPTLTGVTTNGAEIEITGSLQSSAKGTFALDFFVSDDCDPSGYGEGSRYLGAADVNTDASGHVSVSVTLGVSVMPGTFVTATATDPEDNTSELSGCVEAEGTTTVERASWGSIRGRYR